MTEPAFKVAPHTNAVPGRTPIDGWQNPRGGFLFFLAFAAIGAGMALLFPLVLTFSWAIASVLGALFILPIRAAR